MVARPFGDYSKIDTFLALIEAFVDRWYRSIIGDLENGGHPVSVPFPLYLLPTSLPSSTTTTPSKDSDTGPTSRYCYRQLYGPGMEISWPAPAALRSH